MIKDSVANSHFLSVFIRLLSVGQFFFAVHILPTPPSLTPSITSDFQLRPTRRPSRIIQPAVKPGRADRRSLVNPRQRNSGVRSRAKQASRPGNIEKRAGHGRESILWLIRTSRKWREVTAKGNRRAQLPVDLETFLRPESVPAGNRFCGLKNPPAEAVVRCAG